MPATTTIITKLINYSFKKNMPFQKCGKLQKLSQFLKIRISKNLLLQIKLIPKHVIAFWEGKSILITLFKKLRVDAIPVGAVFLYTCV